LGILDPGSVSLVQLFDTLKFVVLISSVSGGIPPSSSIRIIIDVPERGRPETTVTTCVGVGLNNFCKKGLIPCSPYFIQIDIDLRAMSATRACILPHLDMFTNKIDLNRDTQEVIPNSPVPRP
jgi:hypothetical protein